MTQEKDDETAHPGERLESWWNLCTQGGYRRLRRKTRPRKRSPSMPTAPVPPEKQAEFDDLEEAIHEAVDAEIGELAANLATTDDAHLFGATSSRSAPRPQDRRQADQQHARKNGDHGAGVTARTAAGRRSFIRTACTPPRASSRRPLPPRDYLRRCRGKAAFSFDRDAGLTPATSTPAPERVAAWPGRAGLSHCSSYSPGCLLRHPLSLERLSDSWPPPFPRRRPPRGCRMIPGHVFLHVPGAATTGDG